MINIYLYNILSTFSEKEWSNFVLYIKSYDVVSRRKYLPLVLELKKYRMKLSELKKISIAEIFSRAYNRTVNIQTLFNRQTELLNLVKKFLKNITYEKNELLQTSLYFDELISRNLINQFSRDYGKNKNVMENCYYDENSYKILSKILDNKSEYFASKGNSTESVNAYYESTNVLFAEILSNLYRSGQEFQILKQHTPGKQNSLQNFMDSIDSDKLFNELEKQNKSIYTVPLIHYYIFKSLQNPVCKKYISKAKQIFFANEKHFPEKFKLHIYGKIMSHYYIKINNGEEKYFKDLYLLFKRKLSQNLVSDFTEHYFFYNNVFCEYVITGLKVKQFKWVEKVIKKYSPFLPENIREDEYTLAMIRLYFTKKEYAKVIEIIKGNKIQNKKHYIDSIYYRLMSYYELGNFEECYLEIDNTRHYLKNNKEKILRIRALPLKKFIDGFSKLLNFRMNPYDKDINNIYYEFEKLDILKEDWMYEKINEI